MPKGIIIKPTEDPRVITIKDDSEIGKLLGGWLEGVFPCKGIVCYVDEEGLMKNLPQNVLTTMALRRYSQLPTRQMIVGPSLWFGTLNAEGVMDGETHDLPDAVIKDLLNPKWFVT